MSGRLRLGALVVAGLAAGAALGEVALRLAFPSYRARFRTYTLAESERGKFARYHSALGWAGIPGAEGTFEWLDCRHHVRQNRHGWRGPAREPGSPRAARLAVLGDSFVWGFGVEDDEIFTQVLEEGSPTPAEVVNMGVSGYGTDQELLAWRAAGREWRPERVLLAVTTYTDLYDNVFPERYGYPKPFFLLGPGGSLALENVPVPPRPGAWADGPVAVRYSSGRLVGGLAARSAVVSLVLEAASRRPSLRRALEAHDVVPPRLGGHDWERDLYRQPLDRRHEAAWSLLLALVRELRREVESGGASLSVLLVPSVVQVYPDLWTEFAAAGPGALDPDLPNRILGGSLRREGIAVVDPLPALREAGRTNPNLYFPANRHWTADGHRLVAEVLLRELGGSE